MKVLVTGSSGHLGEAVVRTLRDKKIDFISLDLTPSGFTTAVGSITDRPFVRECMKGVDFVLHTATLHKPHIVTHTNQGFIDTNITGTLNLLEEAVLAGVQGFIYTSTTSTFGDALTPPHGAPAAWVTEKVTPIPKNIYGVTKTAAEDLCKLFQRNKGLACIILKTSRFFPDADDQEKVRQAYDDNNLKANELLYRRVDLEDVVAAHLLSLDKVQKIGFGSYIISATTPFTTDDLMELNIDAPAVVKRIFPQYEKIYAEIGWRMLPQIERVYVNKLARTELGWAPKYDFEYILTCLKDGKSTTSPLAQAVGIKAYHQYKFDEGMYPV